ncbi:MAG: hypothetical protein JSS34_08115 [Proteobacteria bacterium]|nr:hypothetical protein [Pseudomonadota bacterium]
MFFTKLKEGEALDFSLPNYVLFEMDLKTEHVQCLGDTYHSTPVGELEGHQILSANENYTSSYQVSYFNGVQEILIDGASDGDDLSVIIGPVIFGNDLYYLSDKGSDFFELHRCQFLANTPMCLSFHFSNMGLSSNILDFKIAPDGLYSALFIQENTCQQWVIFQGCFVSFHKKLSPLITNLSFLFHKKCIVSYHETTEPPSHYVCDVEDLSTDAISLKKPFLTPPAIFSDPSFYAPHYFQFIPSSDFKLPCHFTLPSFLGHEPRSALILFP